MAERSSSRALAPAPPGYAHELRDPKPLSKVSRACIECRKRKVKCTGETPCKTCTENNVTCTIDEENDGRRKLSLKRKVHTLEKDQDLLMRLVEAIREESDGNVARLLDLIRSNASLQEIRLFLAEKLDDTPPSKRFPSLEQIRSGTQTPESIPIRPKVMDVKRLSDEPLFKVPARPWTSVTDDDHFVSHLISLWFTWHNSTIFNWIDRDLFLKDMQSRELDSMFCSSFLVNIILAEACTYSDYPESFAIYNDITSKGAHFYNEAKRFLDAEEGRVNLTTAQGLGVMCTCTIIMGKDRLGWMYGVHAVEGARQIAASQAQIKLEKAEYTPEMKQAVENAIWGLYNSMTAGALALQRPPPMRTPQGNRTLYEHKSSDLWAPYPVQLELSTVHTNCVFDYMCCLTEISYDTATFLFGDEIVPRAQLETTADALYERLQRWHDSLPDCIAFERGPMPGILCLHMYYHTIIMTLFGFLKYPLDSDEQSVAYARCARDKCTASAGKVAEMIAKHQSQWGMEYAPAAYLQWINIALFTLLEDLHVPKNRATFIDLCRAARFFARRWPLAKGTFRLLALTAKHLETTLPEEVLKLFQEFETELWRGHGRPRFSSLYPNFALAIRRRRGSAAVDSAELDKFLDKWDHLSLAEG